MTYCSLRAKAKISVCIYPSCVTEKETVLKDRTRALTLVVPLCPVQIMNLHVIMGSVYLKRSYVIDTVTVWTAVMSLQSVVSTISDHSML